MATVLLPALPVAVPLPALVLTAGEKAVWRFVEFFTATIRNPHTREAYFRAVAHFFTWCERQGVQEITAIRPVMVAAYAAYIEQQQALYARPTVKQHLAAIQMLFDWLVSGGIIDVNPAYSVKSLKHVVHQGKTPILDVEQTRHLLDSIKTRSIVGVRDRALIAVMVYTFGRVSAVIGMHMEDYYSNGKRWWFRLHEKGGKMHAVPAHHKAEAYVDAYLDAAGIRNEAKGLLFRSVNRHKQLTTNPLDRRDVLAMIKRRAKAAGLPATTCCHTFRATGIPSYMPATLLGTGLRASELLRIEKDQYNGKGFMQGLRKGACNGSYAIMGCYPQDVYALR